MRRPPEGRVLIDTGPLVAILDRQDSQHRVCVKTLTALDGPLYTCWPVITEAAWLLRHSPRAIQQLLGSVNTDFVELLPLAGSEAEPLAFLMKKYDGIRPQLADVCLVYLAGREGIHTVFTLDRRGFSIYRSNRRRLFRIIPET